MAWYDDYGDAWNAHDADRIVSFLAEDGTYEDLALGIKQSGRAAVAAWIKGMEGEFSSDFRFDFADPVSVTGDGYALEWVMRGTHDGPNGPLPPTGKSYEIHGVSVGRLDADGKITENRDYWSMGEFLVQIGILPPMELSKPPAQ